MAKNLVQCLSPVVIGLKVAPNWPTSPNSGELCRLGDKYAVCVVDHKDSLAGGSLQRQASTDKADGTPVLNPGLNVWEFSAAATDTAIAVGDIVYHYHDSATDGGHALTVGIVSDGFKTKEDKSNNFTPTTSSDAEDDITIADEDASTVTRRRVGVVVGGPGVGIVTTAGTKYKVHVLMGN